MGRGGGPRPLDPTVLGGSYQLGPVYDVLPAEMFARKLLFKLLLGHLWHQEVGLVQQGGQHVCDAP